MGACHHGELAMLVTAQTPTACGGGRGGEERWIICTHTLTQVSFLCVAAGLLATSPKSIFVVVFVVCACAADH